MKNGSAHDDSFLWFSIVLNLSDKSILYKIVLIYFQISDIVSCMKRWWIKLIPELSPTVTSSILERYNESFTPYEFPWWKDLNKQILARIQEIYDNPDWLEVDATRVREENQNLVEEMKLAQKRETEVSLFLQYTKYAHKKQLQSAITLFRKHWDEIISGHIRFKETQRLVSDVQLFALLLSNKQLSRLVPKNWLDHTLVDLFIPVLQHRWEVIEQSQDAIRTIAKYYPKWKIFLQETAMKE